MEKVAYRGVHCIFFRGKPCKVMANSFDVGDQLGVYVWRIDPRMIDGITNAIWSSNDSI